MHLPKKKHAFTKEEAWDQPVCYFLKSGILIMGSASMLFSEVRDFDV